MENANQSVRVAAFCAYASGIVSIFGIVFLLAFFGLGAPTGRLNDIAVIVQYSLMLPIAFAVYQILREFNPRLNLVVNQPFNPASNERTGVVG